MKSRVLALIATLLALTPLALVLTPPKADAFTTIYPTGADATMSIDVIAGNTVIIEPGAFLRQDADTSINRGTVIVRGEWEIAHTVGKLQNFGHIIVVQGGIIRANNLGGSSTTGSLIENRPGGTIMIDNGAQFNFNKLNNTGLITNYGSMVNEYPGGSFEQCSPGQFANHGAYDGEASRCTPPAPPPFTPVTHMSDTTVSYGVLVNSPTQIFSGEWVKPTSQLVGDRIDSITLRLQRSGNPAGTYTVGVYDSSSPPALKKSFGIVSAASLPAVMTDLTFTIPDMYTIVAGDRIGVFYNGNSGGVLVMMDKVTTDSMFDGQNSQRVRYGTSWITSDFNEDLYMILRQTKA